MTGPRGFDAAKKVDGIKRHILVDTTGILVAATVTVTAADTGDRAAFPELPRQAKRAAPTIGHVWLDTGYTRQTAAQTAAKTGVSVDTVAGPKPVAGFRVQPRRWAVERTNG